LPVSAFFAVVNQVLHILNWSLPSGSIRRRASGNENHSFSMVCGCPEMIDHVFEDRIVSVARKRSAATSFNGRRRFVSGRVLFLEPGFSAVLHVSRGDARRSPSKSSAL